MDSAAGRLIEVDEQIERHEDELARLRLERARLHWALEEGDHS